MRNLSDYIQNFDELPFEYLQSGFRKKNFCEFINEFPIMESVLEVGCGESSIFEYKKFSKQTIIEPIQEFIDRLKLRTNCEAISIECCRLEEFTTNNKYNLIVASCLLHEVDEQNLFLKKLTDFMSNDGYLYIDVPNAHSLHRHLAVETGHLENVYERSTTQNTMQQLNKTFDRKTLKSFVEENGLTVVSCGGYFLKPFHHEKMQQLVDLNHLTVHELDAFYQLGKRFQDLASEIFVMCQRKDSQ